MILVSGDNYLMLFVGWEGVGLCSYLLIGFWYDKDTLGRPSFANADAGKKAFITNRVGDFGFLIAGFLMFWTFKTVQFDQVFEQVHHIAESPTRHDPGDHPLYAAGCGRKISPDPTVCLAARCHGWPHTRFQP